ncbi:glycosyltransferase [soil metagenome]
MACTAIPENCHLRCTLTSSMRIVHVVTLVSPDAAFGGPLRIAVNQCQALIDLGHDVTLVAAARGFEHELPQEIGGVPVVLFPARTAVPGAGFAGLDSTEMRQWLKHNLRNFDLVHVHLARDLVMLPALHAVRKAKVPYVIQTHGTISVSANPITKLVDLAATKRYLKGAAAVIVLDAAEGHDVSALVSKATVIGIPNGVPFSTEEADPGARDALFLSRLTAQKRPLVFLEAAEMIAPEFPGWSFSVVGPDAGEGEALAIANVAGAVHIEGPLPIERTADRMRRSAIYVLPAIDEPYAMAMIEAMAVGVPVIVHDDCRLAQVVIDVDAGLVFHGGAAELTVALRILMGDPELRARMGAAGRAYVRENLAMDAIARNLEAIYQERLDL